MGNDIKKTRINTEIKIFVTSECVKGYNKGVLSDDEFNFRRCEKCDFRDGGYCSYQVVKMKAIEENSKCWGGADGTLPSSTYEWRFECSQCGGEMIARSGSSVLMEWGNDPGSVVMCDGCGARHYVINRSYSNETGTVYTFVVPIKDVKS